VHVPLQFVWPKEQHLPLEQNCPLWQVWPQLPQLFESSWVLTHAPPQLVNPVGQQMPDEQI
jgi:hypothetical protein